MKTQRDFFYLNLVLYFLSKFLIFFITILFEHFRAIREIEQKVVATLLRLSIFVLRLQLLKSSKISKKNIK